MKHTVLTHKASFDIVLAKLQSGLPFSFVRFGDGDHILMYKQSIGEVVGGGNRFIVTEELQREIIDCYNIQDKDFLIGTMLNDNSDRQMSKTESYIDPDKLPDELIERDTMLAMSCLFETFRTDLKRFALFVKELQKTSTLFVGPYNSPDLMYGKITHVKVTPINCYSNIDLWYDEILENIGNVDKVVLSCGFCGRVVAKRLWDLGIRLPVLDVGSLSDIFIFGDRSIIDINRRGFMINMGREIVDKVNTLRKII